MKNFERLIPITIKEAKIKRITINYEDVKKLGVSIEVGLITDDKQFLTSIYVGTDSWDEKKNIQIPIEFSHLAGQLEDLLKVCVAQHMNKFQKKIGGGANGSYL